QMLKRTSTNSPGLSSPSEKSPSFTMVKVDPTPPGPKSAFCSKFPLVNVETLAMTWERDGLGLSLVSVALKLNFPIKPPGHPDASVVVLKVELFGTKETNRFMISGGGSKSCVICVDQRFGFPLDTNS